MLGVIAVKTPLVIGLGMVTLNEGAVLVTARFVVAAASNTHLFAFTTDYKLAVDFTVKAELKPPNTVEKLS